MPDSTTTQAEAMTLARRAVLAAGMAALAAPAAVLAQPGWRPSRPVRIITPFPPGGTLDVIARLLGEPLGGLLGQPVVVENRTGAGGNIAAAAAIQAEPDGHSLLLGSAAILGVNPVLYPGSGLNPVRDLAGIGTVATLPNILVVNPKRFDVHSVAEVVAAARARPGRVVYGSIGNGTSSHLAGEMFSRATGIEVVHVPYRGGSPALAALLAGEFDYMFEAATSAVPQILNGGERALAVTSRRRAALLPAVPTMEEAGIQPFDISVWNALFVPVRTPAAVVAAWQAALAAVLTPAIQDRLRSLATEPLLVPAAELPEWLVAEAARWRGMAEAIRLQAT